MTNKEVWCEKFLDYAFSDTGLLAQALTHRSAAPDHNERLEFLGDAVLGMVIAHSVYNARPGVAEGDLTRLRATLVRRETLAAIAREINLGPQLQLGPGEGRTGGGGRASVLANACEAVLGAIYLDGGYAAVETAIQRIFHSRLASLPDIEDLKDSKTKLQERLQADQLTPPDYALESVTGPAHAQTFEIVCRVEALGLEGKGAGTSRRRAEQKAAKRVLEQLSSG